MSSKYKADFSKSIFDTYGAKGSVLEKEKFRYAEGMKACTIDFQYAIYLPDYQWWFIDYMYTESVRAKFNDDTAFYEGYLTAFAILHS